MSGVIRGLGFDVPVEPEPPIATEWLINELSKPVYQAAKPTLLDIIAKSIQDWLESLQFGDAQGPPALGLALLAALVVIALVVAFLIFGMPRLNRRSSVSGALFGDDDSRSADAIRRAAERAADSGDYAVAIAEMFRAIARGLAERTILSTSPGTTAREFAELAAAEFAELRSELVDAARSFDEVRYLDRAGTAAQYARLATLEAALRASRPQLNTVPA